MQEIYEQMARAKGFSAICGVDEAGRGPLAGPVVAAAVILPVGAQIEGLNDSKKLSEKKRETLYTKICEVALAYHIAYVDAQTIDECNILQATFLAMRKAVEGLAIEADFALIDGNQTKGLSIPAMCIVGGDGKSPSIAAASILAKVSRDRTMQELDALYPFYGFAKHKGYGTKQHYEALRQHGASPIHRQSFLKKFWASSKPNTQQASMGTWGEAQAAQYLQAQGYQILMRQFRTREGEVDLIAQKDGVLAFVEVKTRKGDTFATAREAVDTHKQRRILQAAQAWIQEQNAQTLQPRFDVIEVYPRWGAHTSNEIFHYPNAF